MNIIYTNHVKLRLALRRIPEEYPRLIFEKPEQKFFDIREKRIIAIKKLKYNHRLRYIMIAYEIKNACAFIITIHPIREDQIINRIKSGRWQKK